MHNQIYGSDLSEKYTLSLNSAYNKYTITYKNNPWDVYAIFIGYK